MILSEFYFRETLRNFNDPPESLKDKVDFFISENTIGYRYVLGRNDLSISLIQSIEITGFIDDFTETGFLWHGKPVIKTSDLSPQDAVINCSMSISPVSAWQRLRNSRSLNVLNYSDCCRARPDIFNLPSFVTASRIDFIANEKNISNLYNNLADDESRIVMKAIMNYRLTADPHYMENFSVRFLDQYFEDFLDIHDAVFIDAGGYDGDTTKEFCRRFPFYKRVYFFEPSAVNINLARARLTPYRDIQFIQQGLSDAKESLWFNSDAGSASSISEQGSVRIDVNMLDNFVVEKVDFIKMDLEGWEMQALAGATQHILADHPTLAISVYHHAGDLWRIYELVMKIRKDYQVYLRHYTEGWSETVMFFCK